MARTPARPLASYDAFLFDLDGTLYDERAYLRAGYADIALLVSERFGLDRTVVGERLWSGFIASGRRGLFDDFCSELGLPRSFVPEMIEALRKTCVPGGLLVYPWAERQMQWIIKSGRRFAIVTNGNPKQQHNKRAQLSSPSLAMVSAFICANELAPKPSGRALLAAAEAMSVAPCDCLMVGDDEVDRRAAQDAGIDFVFVESMKRRKLPVLDQTHRHRFQNARQGRG